MDWWKEKRYRMIQNNLRDIDASMDTEKFAVQLEELGADVCMAGCGGITAFYDSRLDCQRKSPYMEGDFFGRLLDSCHKRGIRVIARFDFSKVHIEYGRNHPEWFTKSLQGEMVAYHDTAATCVNGPYQQEYTLAILEEVISRYPVDGVFFNMFGYQTKDYSDHYTGICQCDSCKARFKEYSGGLVLPVAEDISDPVFCKYQEFKKDTVEELLLKIRKKVKECNPEVAVCTYHHGGVDLVRNESNSAVDRPYPFWLMSGESNVSTVRGTYDDRFSSNCCINAVDIYYRFMGVSKYLNALRLYGSMAASGNLDWCIIGGFEDYPDRSNFQMVKAIYHFHKKYQDYFNKMKSTARVLLLNPSPFGTYAAAAGEYSGIFKALKEEHILFDVLDAGEGGIAADRLEDYDVVIIPGIRELDGHIVDALKDTRATVVATGMSMEGQPEELYDIFGVKLKELLEPVRSSYLLTEPKEVFEHFPDRDWVYLDGQYRRMETAEGNAEYLPLISPARYGPPERCFGHRVTGQAGVSVRHNQMIYFPWMLGSLYRMQGYEDFKYLLLDVWKKTEAIEQIIEVEAPKCVEVFFDQCGEKQYLLQLLNYSGFNGTTVWEPIPIHDMTIHFPSLQPVRITELSPDREITREASRTISVDIKELYQALLIETK